MLYVSLPHLTVYQEIISFLCKELRKCCSSSRFSIGSSVPHFCRMGVVGSMEVCLSICLLCVVV